MKKNIKNSYGYIALITVLILTGILILIALFFSRSEILVSEIPLKLYNSFQAKEYAHSCAEIALNKFLTNQNYTGNETQNFQTGGTCNILTIETQGTQKILKTIGEYKNIKKRLKIIFEFDDTQGKINIISWEEVDQF